MSKIYNKYKSEEPQELQELQELQDRIIFNDDFNNPIETCINILSLKKTIVFGKSFNQNLENIPSNVERIYLGKYFQKSLTNIPSHVKSICFANDSIFYNYLDYLHDDVEELILGDNYDTVITKLPSNLKTLVLGCGYNLKINAFGNLKYLDIGNSYTYSLDNLPNSLRTLVIGGEFNNYIKFPDELENFIIKKDCAYNRTLNDLPKSLIYLSIKNNYTQPIIKLPDSINVLEIGGGYVQSFPPNLVKIILSDINNFDWTTIKLLNTIKIIEISKNNIYMDKIMEMYPHAKIIIK